MRKGKEDAARQIEEKKSCLSTKSIKNYNKKKKL